MNKYILSLLLCSVYFAGCGNDNATTPDPSIDASPLPDVDAAVRPETCNFQNCDGCCDGNVCINASSNNACGLAGLACESCVGDDSCVAGSCVPAADCSDCDGCCLDGTQCLEGNTQVACGSDGTSCVACPEGQGCNGGLCQAFACDVSNCANGCCTANGECITADEQSTNACGDSAQACNVCGPDAIGCISGTCVEDQPCLDFCTDGCCNSNGQCILFADQAPNTCGTAETCSACAADLSCVGGSCTTDPVWQVVVKSAVIAPLDPKGGEWDQGIFTNPLPDPYVGGSVGEDVFFDWFTPTIDNTLTPNWDSSEGTYLQSDLLGSFSITVRDSDGLGVFEEIGGCGFLIDLDDLQAGTLTKSSCGNSVADLVLNFVRQ